MTAKPALVKIVKIILQIKEKGKYIETTEAREGKWFTIKYIN